MRSRPELEGGEKPDRPALEIAAQDIDGARTAAACGADRLELCQALDLGGLTPSLGMMQSAAGLGVPVRPLIRPRAGGYRYTTAEKAVMRRDAEAFMEAGAAGVVVGALGEEGLDRAALRDLVRAAQGRPVVIHRCVDVLLSPQRNGGGRGPAELIEELVELGIGGVLTSGGASRAAEGIEMIAALAEASAGRMEVIAGGGAREADVAALAAAGADVVHLSAGSPAAGVGPSGPGGGEDSYMTTDPTRVSAVREVLDAL